MIRLNTKVGEYLRLGGQQFRIAAELVSEPDRMTGTLTSAAGADHARRSGSHGTDHGRQPSFPAVLISPAPDGPHVDRVRDILKRSFPESTIADFRETHPVVTRGLNRSTTFLSLTSLVALIVGALGVATAMHAHVQQKMDIIAILKCLGARSGQVIGIYVMQTLFLALCGGLIGVAFGAAIQLVFPFLIAKYFSVRPPLGWDPAAIVQGLTIGVLTTLLFTIPPLLGIRRIRPNLIFRRDMEDVRRTRHWTSPAGLLSAALIVVGIGLVAAWLTQGGPRYALRLGAYFAGGLVVGLLALMAIARLLLRLLKSMLARSRRPLPAVVRHGLANLYRPGSQATGVLVALGIGVMFTLTIFLLQRSLVVQMANSAPPGMPNVFLLDIPGPQRQAVADLVRGQKGVEGVPEVVASVSAKLTAINGVPLENLPLQNWGRRFLRTRAVTWAGSKPPETEVLQGAWWDPQFRGEPLVCVADEAAEILGIKAGSRLQWDFWGRTVDARVACIQRTESIRMAGRFEFLFNPGVLDGFPAVFYGSARVRPAAVASLQRIVYEKFPTVTVVNVADVLEIIQQVIDQIALVYRFVSAFTIAAGVIILASAVAGTRFRRIREVAILKTLGGTRRRIAAMFSVEFLLLGTVAGAMGSLLACGLAAIVMIRVMEVNFRFDWLPNLIAILTTALLANAAGWAASFRILGQKPLEVLRSE